VEKYGKAGQATDDDIIRRLRIACWITKATSTHSERVSTYCFCTATMVTVTRVSVTFIRTLRVLVILKNSSMYPPTAFTSLCDSYNSRRLLPHRVKQIGLYEVNVECCVCCSNLLSSIV
jgi:hypothetical protein